MKILVITKTKNLFPNLSYSRAAYIKRPIDGIGFKKLSGLFINITIILAKIVINIICRHYIICRHSHYLLEDDASQSEQFSVKAGLAKGKVVAVLTHHGRRKARGNALKIGIPFCQRPRVVMARALRI